MTLRSPALGALLPVLCFGQSFIRNASSDAAIEIHAEKKADYQIPRSIYGTFLEPIGESIYPGLWAQILTNPSFEADLWSAERIKDMLGREPPLARSSRMGLPLPWEPLDQGQGMRYEPRWGDAANSARSLLIMALPGHVTGVRQQVFLPVHRVLRYNGSLYAKRLSGPTLVFVSLRRRNHPDDILARSEIKLAGEDWARYQFAFELSADQLAPLEPADFVVAVSNDARTLIDQVFLFPADAIDGMDPDMIAMAKALKTPVLRFGGNFTSGYHWRDGVGPVDKRVSMLNQAWGMPEYNHFGTDEFLRFCQLIGAEPQIALNLGSGTAPEAAEWVRYVNERWGDHRGGLLWELGNELWGTFQIGYPTAERIATRTKDFSAAVRRADPSARLIATGQDPDRFHEWNALQLANAPGAFQYLSTHFVVTTSSVVRSKPSPQFVAQSAFALPVGLERRLREMKTQAGGKANIAFTEWLFHGRDDRTPRYTNMGGAICAAGFLNTLIRVADFTPISDMTGLIEFAGIWKKRGRVFGVPAYWAFRMYSTADAVTPVETVTKGDAYDIEAGNQRIPDIRDVPYLDVVAALNAKGDRLTLFAVNRHLTADIPAHLHLSGFAAHNARVQTLQAPTISRVNDESRPSAVVPSERSIEIHSAAFDYAFPRASVTVMELRP